MKAKKSMWRVIRSMMMVLAACLLVVGVIGCAPKPADEPAAGEPAAQQEEAPASEAAPEAPAAPEAGN